MPTYAAGHCFMLARSFNGWGVTLFDSLDTMIMMGLNDEFARSLPVISRATFETTTVSKSSLTSLRPN